ncbi:hypothetical protein DL96DRAFT_1823921 [Flagelloscypha sp. PMI_526]|nr:hypothetical protein DL96DRAFT_1823921 [Flagelloscypha sp. PMI_526]
MKTNSSPIPISLFVRVACFSMGTIVASILSGTSIVTGTAYHNPAVVLVTAGAPLLAAVVFGTQRDILSVWMFWKRSVRGTDFQFNKEAQV